MKKIKIDKKIPSYPTPTTLVGAHVEKKVNFITISWLSVLNYEPPMIAIVLNKDHYTNNGIKENKTFSINIPSVDMVKATDYCSTVSGYDADKSKLFDIFYGSLKTAPMITECPLTLACKLVQTLEFATHDVFVGEIIEMYTDEQYMTHGHPDIKKINPIIYSHYDNKYWKLGEFIGQARHIGKHGR